MKGIRKILVASNGCPDLVRTGVRMADEEKSWLTVLKVLPPYEGDLFLTGIKNIKEVLNDHSEMFSQEVKAIARKERSLIKTRIEQGQIEQKIVEVAKEEQADLIIIGARKTRWLDRIFGNSIVDNVINRSHCPVYVVGE